MPTPAAASLPAKSVTPMTWRLNALAPLASMSDTTPSLSLCATWSK